MSKSQNTKNEQLTEQWVNIYKSKKHGSYWTGAFCYKTKEEAVKDLADKENYLTTVNIEDMLQKTENVAKNIANKNSQDLTEQYKHGNLPDDRLYYYRFKGELKVQITTQYGLYCEEEDNKKEIEVIDFVPSYEEWEQLENWASFTDNYHALKEKLEIAEYENAELKEVLHIIKRQCELLMPKNGLNPVGDRAVMKMFLTKIDEVLK